jgi:valyl-tRNA synthetase
MSEIPKAYEPQAVEEKWYQFWLDGKCFVANALSLKPAYSIVIPPPNVTGMLHMGHVLNNTIQDILSRKARMDGKEVLWLPGTDHAGIATQVMVEKQVKKEEHKTRHDLGREEFLKRVWKWKEKHGDIIIQQLKKLGCSCDWTRERFTMDPEYSRCVQKVFVDLYKKGLIYRGKRMVNWCPATLTALSDEEVDMEPQKGFLWHFKVEVAEEPGTFLTIATTRPETIPGDTAVAVNPKDPRYSRLIGKHAIRPLPSELPRDKKLIPIVGDDHIDPEFGTGVLKVTPAHDKADFEIGQRHRLPAIDIMNPNGSMNDLAGTDLAGLDRFEARKVAVEKLKALGSFVKEDPYENKVGFSQRARVPIEPRLSEQWFLKYPSVEKSRACVEQDDAKGSAGASPAAVGALADGCERAGSPDGIDMSIPQNAADEASAATPEAGALPNKMRFHPQRWAKVYDHWLSNIQDWCISRQLWWGHRIPVWYRKSDSSCVRQNAAGIGSAADSRPQPREVWCDVNPPPDPENWVQDPDVLDTWFSSWLWPFATMGWPEQTDTLKKFYPTTDLVTGPDIIFFWVARMIMAGYEFMGQPKFALPDAMPFRNVYFTGIIRDKQGRKMSKTLGNSPDPLDLIARYGADALRFGTMRSAPLGQDVLFDEKDVELGRNFCNKLWNACRFRQIAGSAPATGASADAPSADVQGEINPQLLTSDDKWILLKLDQAIRDITTAFEEYKFNEATATLYRFFWNEYCDWYVEASKAVLTKTSSEDVTALKRENVTAETDVTMQRGNDATIRQANTLAVIDFVLSHTLRLFHPFLPFITEELWHGMGYAVDMPENQGGKTIMFAPWPKPLDADFKSHYGLDDRILDFVNTKYALVTEGRNLRRTGNIPSSKKVKFVLKPAGQTAPQDLEVIKLLLNAEALEVNLQYQPAKGTPTARSPLGELFLPLEGLLDVAAEKARLTKELDKIESEIAKAEQKLANPNFAQKAPPQVLEEHRKRLAEWREKRRHAKNALDSLG